MTTEFSRAELLSKGAKGGAALLVVGSGLGAMAASASGAQLPDSDLASLRFLIATELLGADFYSLAVQSAQFSGRDLRALKSALFNEQQHYAALSLAVTSSFAPTPPAVSTDFSFTYPRNSFSSPHAVAKLGQTLETVKTGAYLGALAQLQTLSLAPLFGTIAGNEAQHLTVFNNVLGSRPFTLSFPDQYTIANASIALDSYID
jgi:hypothetical protein